MMIVTIGWIRMKINQRYNKDRKGDDMKEIVNSIFLHQIPIIFLADTSVSMTGQRIDQLNEFMSEAVKIVEEFSSEEEVSIPIRVIEFNSCARWIFGDTNDGVYHVDWLPLKVVSGTTDTAAAIDLANSIMHRKILGDRLHYPVVVLISDGIGNDFQKSIEAIERLKYSFNNNSTYKKECVIRMAVCVEGADMNELNTFSSICDIENYDGTIEKNCPLVINPNDIGKFKSLLKSFISWNWSKPSIIPYNDIDATDWDNDDWIE